MVPYERMYFRLFNAVTDALRCLDQGHTADAKTLLKLAQLLGEETYVESGLPPDEAQDPAGAAHPEKALQNE